MMNPHFRTNKLDKECFTQHDQTQMRSKALHNEQIIRSYPKRTSKTLIFVALILALCITPSSQFLNENGFLRISNLSYSNSHLPRDGILAYHHNSLSETLTLKILVSQQKTLFSTLHLITAENIDLEDPTKVRDGLLYTSATFKILDSTKKGNNYEKLENVVFEVLGGLQFEFASQLAHPGFQMSCYENPGDLNDHRLWENIVKFEYPYTKQHKLESSVEWLFDLSYGSFGLSVLICFSYLFMPDPNRIPLYTLFLTSIAYIPFILVAIRGLFFNEDSGFEIFFAFPVCSVLLITAIIKLQIERRKDEAEESGYKAGLFVSILYMFLVGGSCFGNPDLFPFTLIILPINLSFEGGLYTRNRLSYLLTSLLIFSQFLTYCYCYYFPWNTTLIPIDFGLKPLAFIFFYLVAYILSFVGLYRHQKMERRPSKPSARSWRLKIGTTMQEEVNVQANFSADLEKGLGLKKEDFLSHVALGSGSDCGYSEGGTEVSGSIDKNSNVFNL